MAGDWQSIQNHLHPYWTSMPTIISPKTASLIIQPLPNTTIAAPMPCTAHTHPQTDAHVAILNDPNIQKITANALQYFKLFPVDWDIEYRPWAMGFDTIPTLRTYIERLHNHPDDYSAIIKEWQGLKQARQTKRKNLIL